ncbi:MAG: cytochrome P450, partial [Myxococcota bacterium]
GHLEKGINPIAHLYPHAPLPRFRRRDAARRRLVAQVDAIFARRQREKESPDDGMQALMDARYKDGGRLDAHEITGIFIAIMMAGHHTSAGTAAWTVLELVRRPELLARVRAEVDAHIEPDGSLSYQALRQMRVLHDVIKEVLRLHPPLIFLFRKVLRDFSHGATTVPAGSFLCASPGVAHRLGRVFPDPERFDPDRYARGEDRNPFAWIAFGGGKHKCTGNAFGLLQLKAVVATLVHAYDFELAQPDHTYRDNYETATVMPWQPCQIRYRERSPEAGASPVAVPDRERQKLLDRKRPVVVAIDPGLCQGHSVCVSELPSVFRIGKGGEAQLLDAGQLMDGAVTYGHDAPSRNALYDALERAHEHCPNAAISLTQEPA